MQGDFFIPFVLFLEVCKSDVNRKNMGEILYPNIPLDNDR